MHPEHREVGRDRWKALIPLGVAQFLVVLDTSVMNVSISQLVADFSTAAASAPPPTG